MKSWDVVVVGAGAFGAWTALHLARRKQRVLLVDAYGPANARASSGGESRIIRMSYGADELYTRWSQASLTQWKELFATFHQQLFHQTGVLWLTGKDDTRLRQSSETLMRCGVQFDQINRDELEVRYPQINFDGTAWGIFEPHSGVLLARRAVAIVVEEAVRLGVEYRMAQVDRPERIRERFEADQFVFACGAWLGKVFPDVLGRRIFASRQEVFFFGVPAGDRRFVAPALPTWSFQQDEVYGMPDLEARGLKIASDRHGELVNPDTQSRVVSASGIQRTREYIAWRFPALRDAPIVETRVCQYENTSNGDFLVDRHPQLENVWLVGGGSGHGFKHGPALGEHVAALLLERADCEARFSLATKGALQNRSVY
jgi:sarcosine oxidase